MSEPIRKRAIARPRYDIGARAKVVVIHSVFIILDIVPVEDHVDDATVAPRTEGDGADAEVSSNAPLLFDVEVTGANVAREHGVILTHQFGISKPSEAS